ncbi:MAG: hypothetical protein AB1716_22720, partial [Planctomycetota bacterium]
SEGAGEPGESSLAHVRAQLTGAALAAGAICLGLALIEHAGLRAGATPGRLVLLPIAGAFAWLIALAWLRRSACGPAATPLVALCALVGGTALLTPLPIRIAPAPPRPLKLVLIATGERNPAARGSEVWLHELAVGPRVLGPEELTFVGAWEMRDGVPLSYRDQPARVRWQAALLEPARLTLIRHEWSGVVEVCWGTWQQRIDLYSPAKGVLEIPLPPQPPTWQWTLFRRLAWAGDAIGLGGLLLLALLVLTGLFTQSGRAWFRRNAGWLRPAAWIAGAAGLAAALLPLTTRPTTWDELLYMGLAFDGSPDARVLNRYFHIHLLGSFMWLCRDPYLGARVLWSVSMAVSLVSLAAATLGLQRLLRYYVLATFAFLLLGQDTFAWSMGLAYADYTLMLLISVAAAVALRPVLRGAELGWGHALALGLLLVLGLRTKETGLALAILPLLYFITPSNALQWDRRVLRLIAAHVLGMAVGLGALMAADGVRLGDVFFGLRPESWQTLWRFNQGPGRAGPYTWLTWMVRPGNFAAFVLYAGSLPVYAALRRDARSVLVLLLPVAGLTLLVGSSILSNPPVAARYMAPFLPVMCLAAALASGQVLSAAVESERARLAVLRSALMLVVLGLVAVVAWPCLEWVRLLDEQTLRRVLMPITIVGAGTLLVLGLAGPRHVRAPLLLGALALMLTANVPPALRVAHSVA